MTLQVAFNNQIISNSVVFEYKARALPTLPSSQHDWLSLDGKNGTQVTWPGPDTPSEQVKIQAPREGQEGVLVVTKGGSAGSPLSGCKHICHLAAPDATMGWPHLHLGVSLREVCELCLALLPRYLSG